MYNVCNLRLKWNEKTRGLSLNGESNFIVNYNTANKIMSFLCKKKKRKVT